ncbi:NAD(P)-dependent oxidoreductase [Erysipelothrix urinaevulpis]|uniref:NAD(P)-dependent oxidoreductase n=1 Tax=Erysipelothrix urinaevulpis TaxID=2683717 RepID=UPI00135BA22D|nr:NAD(P)-dependent oxidoreductase [Erysipelothrix urinaevulpis]
MKIAWIGTGVMGAPMAKHLAKAGYNVSAYNRTFAKAQQLEPEITAYSTIKEVVHDADVIFTIVGYPNDVKEVYDSIIPNAKKGSILVDMTTSSPTLAKEIATKAKESGLIALDAPVTGGDLGAINASLSIMVGGDENAFHKILPLLENMGTTINYMGDSGNGQNAKLANQIAIAGAIAGTAEALTYAKLKNLDLQTMLNVITGGSANSWQAANNGQAMLDHNFKPGFFLKHLLKDLNLAFEEKGDVVLPLLETVRNIYNILNENGFGDEGTQAIIKYYQ